MTMSRSKRLLLLALGLVFLLGALPGPVFAHPAQIGTGPGLSPFFDAPADRGDHVIGVVAAGLFAYPVVQQSKDQPVSVSKANDTVTQFGMAADLGNIGLLAHNYLAGSRFFDLTLGQRIYIVHDSGRVEPFVVTRILRFQALTPHSAYSDFRELGDTAVISAGEMFSLVYSGEYHITFQTCIEKDGEKSWGRLFVLAEPTAAGY